MFFQCFRKGGTCFNIRLDLYEYLFEGRIILLVAKDFQALHQRKTCIDHGGKLPGEDYDLLARYFRLEEFYVFKKILRLFLEFRGCNPDFLQMGPCCIYIGRFNNP